MDHLDRFFQHLVDTIRTSFPQYLTTPFRVAELYQTILPYRFHRRALGLETNQDYELTLTELLAGRRNYLNVDERMRDVLQAELASPNPDPGRFREFAETEISLATDAPLSGAAAAAGSTTTKTPVRPISGITTAFETAPAPRQPTPVATPAVAPPAPTQSRGITVSTPGTGCPYCAGPLPTGRLLVYCPHCGQDLTVRHCPACGSELELGWKFCVSCGRATGAESTS